MRRRLPFLALALLVAACGGFEVPAPHPGPQSANRPARTAPQVRAQPDAAVAGTVQAESGDTVYAIARRYDVSPRALIELNGLRAPFLLERGQRLRLPVRTEHVVERGDTLYAISRRYGVDMYALARANDLSAPYTIRIGQRLAIPAATVTAPEPAPATVAAAPVPAPTPAPSEQPTTLRRAPDPAPPSPPAVVPHPAARRGGFVWPVEGRVVAGFGPQGKGLHNDGINIAAPAGAEVRAAENGVVVYTGNELRGFGNLILIKHADGWVTAYAHVGDIVVARGARVTRGQAIARVGDSGNVREPQLHFELRKGVEAVDPSKHLLSGASV